ncbi:MAG: DUF4325 domain-containing protein [Patescibacteria group bacterium]
MKRDPSKITQFVLDNVESHGADIAPLLAKEFGFSRQRAHIYVLREVSKGNLVKIGNTRWTRYFLADGKHIEFSLKIPKVKKKLDEYEIWAKYIKPVVLRFPENIRSMSNYAFTEIVNNAKDHSTGKDIFIEVDIGDKDMTIIVMDNGVGIFSKIQKALRLSSMRESLLHLSKGKFTTDPSHHSGEGIFFTSRICDRFSILSDDLYYTFKNQDWFLSSEKQESFGKGTLIKMVFSLDSKRTTKQVMDEYSDLEIGFGKTIVAVALSADPNDPHNSRSQAKRLLMGLEKFKKIILDFRGVSEVGQAFVDEVFRVYKNEHPDVTIQYTNASREVESMINRGLLTER